VHLDKIALRLVSVVISLVLNLVDLVQLLSLVLDVVVIKHTQQRQADTAHQDEEQHRLIKLLHTIR
jgi:hypothetical protein